MLKLYTVFTSGESYVGVLSLSRSEERLVHPFSLCYNAAVLARTRTCALRGLEGAIVEVEVDISAGLPSFTLVGLPDAAVQEARERVRAAIRNSGCEFPQKRITVNLAPADIRKEGPAYDLPIAVGILLSSGQIQANVDSLIFLGELSLEGTVRHTTGSWLWSPWRGSSS